MWTNFEAFSINMTREQALSASHPGPCDEEVKALLMLPKIKKQLDKIGPDLIRWELKQFGVWDDDELSDNEANRQRIIWIAAGNIREDTAGWKD